MENQTVFIGGRHYLNPKEVLYLKAEINYTKVYFLSGKKMMVATTIGTIENRLRPFRNLFRINRSTIINIENVKEKSTDQVTLLNGERIHTSRRRKKAFSEFLKYSNNC